MVTSIYIGLMLIAEANGFTGKFKNWPMSNVAATGLGIAIASDIILVVGAVGLAVGGR